MNPRKGTSLQQSIARVSGRECPADPSTPSRLGLLAPEGRAACPQQAAAGSKVERHIFGVAHSPPVRFDRCGPSRLLIIGGPSPGDEVDDCYRVVSAPRKTKS